MNSAGKPKILIVGGFTFSRGEAGSNYVIGLGKAIEGAGFCVEYLAKDGDRAAVRKDFKEFTCHVAQKGTSTSGWRSNLRNLSASEDSFVRTLEQVPSVEFHAVIAYPCGAPTVAALTKLHRLCLAKDWKLAVVVDEWQGFFQFSGMRLRHRVLAIIDTEIQRRIVNKRIKHVIAISSSLERYYNRSGCHAIRVLPMIDSKAAKWQFRPTQEGSKRGLKLLFSGGWWRDRLDLIIEAIVRLRSEGHEVVLEFLGSVPDEIGKNKLLRKQMMQSPQGTFRFHGKVPVENVLPITASADFGVLFRDQAKWSDACFPSKVAEFQALGVPLICNLTSNLDEVLRDGENALIVPHVSAADFVATVRRALALTPIELQCMKQSSLKCAATKFDYRIYSHSLGTFIRDMSVGSSG